jgi:hypothetical protein
VGVFAEGFTPTHIQKPVQNHNGLFGTKKNGSVKESINNDKSGNNSVDDPSNTPFSDSEINSDLKENRPESKNFEHQIYEKISENDTDDESEKQCSIEEIKVGVAKDGSFINIPASQVRDKGLHIPDFLDAETLDGKFDVTRPENLEYSD